jgi:YjcZ-like protein
MDDKNFCIPSQSTYHIEELQRRVPVVGDKALIDLVNGIQVSNEIVLYRKNRGFFGQLIDKVDGSDRQRQILLDGNIIAGQETLYQWVLELTDSLRISQVGLQVTQQSLLETRNAVRNIKQRLDRQEEGIQKFLDRFSQLHQELSIRFNELETRIHCLEVKVSANEDLDRIITAWMAEQSYTNFPWVIQVALLAREIFSSAVLTYELETGNTNRFRSLVVNKILSSTKNLPKNFFGIADLLDRTWKETQPGDRDLTTALLEMRSIPYQRLLNTPILFAIGTTLELATLPEEARPDRPAQSALAICRDRIYPISRTTDSKEFIATVVEETANDYLTLITNKIP